VRGGNLDCKGVIAMGVLSSGSSSGGTQLELLYTTAPLSNSSGVRHVGGSASVNLGSSLRDEEALKSECVWGGSQKRAADGSLESPAAKGLQSQQLKSQVVSVRLLEWCGNARAAASPLTYCMCLTV